MLKLDIKTYMIIFLLVLAFAGIYQQKEFSTLLTQLTLTVLTAVIIDLAINYFKSKKIILPSSAVITGLIVGMVMAAHQNIFYYVLAAMFAIVSKHILAINNKHIFNPANLGLLLVNILFGISMGWWSFNFWLMIIGGLFISYKIKRLHLVASYLLVTSILLMIHSSLKGLGMFDYFSLINLYFVFVMLIEPKTSPIKLIKGIVFGSLIALLGFIFYISGSRFDYLLLSLAVGNLFNSILDFETVAKVP